MTEETTRVWLVERSYGRSEDIVTLVYATPDGSRQLRKQLSYRMLEKKEITAARTVECARLEPVPDEKQQERFRTEVDRVIERYDPGDPI